MNELEFIIFVFGLIGLSIGAPYFFCRLFFYIYNLIICSNWYKNRKKRKKEKQRNYLLITCYKGDIAFLEAISFAGTEEKAKMDAYWLLFNTMDWQVRIYKWDDKEHRVEYFVKEFNTFKKDHPSDFFFWNDIGSKRRMETKRDEDFSKSNPKEKASERENKTDEEIVKAEIKNENTSNGN